MPRKIVSKPPGIPGSVVVPPPLDIPVSAAIPVVRLDPLTPERRSWNMSRIRSTNTGPERVVRRIVTGLGIRYRLHRKDLPGKPDLVFGPRRTVLFVHGCFWHQHTGCPAGRMPKSNREFWETKLGRNTARDRETLQTLQNLGWRCLTVWECETKDPAKLRERLAGLLEVPPPAV